VSRPLAPHVAAAVARGAGGASGRHLPAQPAAAPSLRLPIGPAPHLAAALGRAAGPAAPGTGAAGSAQPRAAAGPLERFAPHVRSAIQFKAGGEAGGEARPDPGAIDFVAYDEKKLGGAPPPPPKRPVYSLSCSDKGGGCRLHDLETGKVRDADTLFAGFVRMGKGGNVYVSPRPGVGLQGDSHPTIASRTPEWTRGQRAIAAGGELGIIGGEIVGHNDKTGHYQTRRNRQQSGMPADRFHPFTEDPREWFKAKE
jgi:hypothetical protein